MTGAPGLIDFFVLEASEYIEQLDGLLLAAGANDPNMEAVQRVARALRGAATMAKLPAFSNVAAAMERVGRAMREGELRWDPSLRASLVAAVDDLKTLLRSARAWTPADDQRARARVAELTLFAPPRTSGAFRVPSERTSGAQGSSFLGSESANIAAGLELLTTRPGDTHTAANVLGRIRALRGVAEVKEVGALADVLEATEDAAHGLDAGGTMSAESRRVIESASAYLRVLAPALRGFGSVDAPSATRDAFSAAVAAWRRRAGEAERVVPIAQLFYDDGSPGVIEASPNPPTSPQARFRLEMVSLAEHLRGVIDSTRRATDPDAVARAGRELSRAVRALQTSAESFGEDTIAARIAEHQSAADWMDAQSLSALESLASSLTEPAGTGERATQQVRRVSSVERQSASRSASPPEAASAVPAAPPEAPTPPPAPRVQVADNASAALIDTTIAALDRLATMPLLEPTPIPEDVVVPIESLLYRGRDALERALEIRDHLRRAPGGPASDPFALEELLDLVELARAE